jgi:hypothetical protein
MLIDDFLPKLEEWVERSRGRIRADVVHEKLIGLGYAGSERTTRRAVAQVKRDWGAGRRRVYRPWVLEPGMWMQYDFGDGPVRVTTTRGNCVRSHQHSHSRDDAHSRHVAQIDGR